MRRHLSSEDKKFIEEFGDILRRYRLITGLSQWELGSLVGVTYQQIHKIEKGVNRISIEKLAALRHELGISIDDMIDEAVGQKPNVGPYTIDDIISSLADLVKTGSALLTAMGGKKTTHPKYRHVCR